MSYKYTWTVTSNYHYDATLTTELIHNYLDDMLDSSGKDNHFYSLSNMGNLSIWPSDREKQHDTSYHEETETDEPMDPVPTNSTYDYYMNFKMATGVNFAELRSSAAELYKYGGIPNGLVLADNTSAGNITFDKNGEIEFAGSNTLARDITFIDGGEVLFTDAGSGTQTLTGLLASKNLEYIDMGFVERGGSSILSGGQVRRNLRDLNVGVSTYNPVSGKTGSGLLVDGLIVRGVLNSVYVASGASVNHLTVGLDRQWSESDISAFLYESNGVLVPTYWGSHTNMTIASGGTATNITLGNGGRVYVSGLSDTVTSEWVVTGTSGGSMVGDGYWKYTTAYASGTGGILKDLNMASSGGLQFEGITDPRATWNYPSNGYLNSRSYMSGFLATAPQSSYVSFGSNASGSNINIGKGGSLYIDKGASVSAISMGGLTTSTTFVNSSGTTDTWIGDRGANLQIRGGYVSGVVMDPVLQTFDYYSAAHDYFWLYSSSLEREYYSSHNSTYPSGAEWSSSVLNSAVSGGYRQYMSAMYNSGAVYTNLGDDTAYNRRYVGGTVNVNGGWIMNVSGFSYLGVAADVDVTVSNNVSTWKTYQYTDGNVSKAIGAVSATLDVTGGAHVYNVKIEGGRVIMTGGGEVNARWHSRENKQSNYNLVEDLDLRIGDVLGLGSAYPAVIEFVGEGSGGYSQAIHDSKGSVTGYVDYFWDAIDPGEIHSVTASKGLVVSANWNKQDFTYIGSGAVTFNGLGTVVLKDNHSRYSSDSYYGTGPYLGSAYDEYYFGVVKGVYNEEDGVLENYTVLDGDVSSGGFDWEGFLMVGSGGVVQNIGSASPLKTGNDIVNSDTWTPEYTRDKCKVLTVVAGGLADNVTVKGAVSNFEHFESQYTESRAGLLVSSGGTATNVTVLEGGIAMAKGGTIDKVFVAAGGVLYLSGWAGAHQVGERDSDYNLQLSGPQYMDTTVLNGVRLDSGGQLTNTLDYGFRKGNAPSVIANKGGGIMNGVTANGVAYVSGLDFAGNITLTKDQQAIDVTVRGYKTITSRDEEGNPTAYNTTIAYMNVSSGGIVKGATVGDEGAIYASNGADMSGLVASGGRIIFANSSGWSDYFAGSATVNGITIKDGGELEVNSKFGLTATDVKIEQDAGLTFTLGKTANDDYTPTTLNGTWTADWGNGTFQTNDGVLTGFGGQFGHEYRDLFYSSAYVSARLSMTIVEGGVLVGGDLRGYGSVLVKNGGKMLDTKLQGVGASIAASGYASGLSATIASGKNAYGTNIYVYGSGAVADATVLNGGYMGVERGGVADGVTMLAPDWYEGPAGNDTEVGPVEFEVMAGGTAKNVVASAGVITLLDGSKEAGTAGPTLSNADVHSAAMLIVKGDGAVLDGTLNLAGTVFTTGKRYEYVEVEVTDPNTGDTYTDWQRVEMNNSVADAATLTVNFDLTELEAPGETAMIDNLANLTGATLDRISVSADQTGGAYVLAGGSEEFKGSLKVIRDGKFAGTITVGGFLQVTDELTYKLSNTTDEGLVFSVLSTDAAITDIIATSDGKELLKGKWSKYAVNIKTEVNQYSKSIWYRIKQAVKTRKGPAGEEDEWIELDNEKGLTLSQYCTVEFKAKNDKGKDSKIVSYTVNYDATAPEFANLRVDSGAQFLQDGVESQVSVEAWDDLDDAPVVEVRVGDGEWTEAIRTEDGRYGFTVSGNVDFQLRATDHAENVKTLTVSVPTVSNVSADILALTNQDVTLTAEFSADSMQRQYSLNGGETWLDYGDDGVVLTENAEVQFRAENIRGYSELATLTVDYIDKTPPADPIAVADVAGVITDQDVTVTATFSEDSALRQYSFNGKNWYDYTDGVVFEKNGSVLFRATDAAGNESAIVTCTVDNILINGPDKHKNDSLFEEDGKINPNLADNETTIGAGTGAIQLDSSVNYVDETTDIPYRNFVGEDDKSDYAQITMSSAAKLRFSISSYDQTKKGKVKFSLISYDPATGKKKVLKSATSSKNKPAETAPVYVNPNDPKTAGLQYFLAVENKGNTSVFYNVELTDSVFFEDGDEGGNNGPLLVKDGKNKVPSANIANLLPLSITKSGVQAVQFDTNEIKAADAPVVEGGWNNFVGYGDSDDYVKLSATQPLKLNFTVTSTDNVKLTVYKLTLNKGKWSSSAVKTLTVSLKSAEKSNPGYVTRSVNGILLDRITDGLDDGAGYYVSVQSTNASKGGKAWYNVSVDSIVYASDDGTNNTLFLDKKNKELNSELEQITLNPGDQKPVPVVLEIDDVEIGKESFNNFVGFGDEYDYAEVEFEDVGYCTFTVDTWGTEKAGAKFTIYKLTRSAEGKKWTKKSLAVISLKNTVADPVEDGYASCSDGRTVEITEATNENTRYFVSMQSVDAKKGKEVYYNVTAAMPSFAFGSALTMPETDSLADSLAITDSLSLDQYDTDVLADGSASSLAELDDKSAWQSLLA